jgi:hypothetical protein
MRVIAQFTDEEVELITRPVGGSGGWNDLFRELQNKLNGNEIELEMSVIERIIRYSRIRSSGGFQTRLKPLENEVWPLATAVLNGLGLRLLDEKDKLD